MWYFNLCHVRDVELIKTTVIWYFKLVYLACCCVTSLFQTCVKYISQKRLALKIHWRKKKRKEKTNKHHPLWFLSGLIYSPLMPFWVLSASFPCEFSSTFTSLPCLWPCIKPSTRWGLLSAFPCIPHWFGLIFELRRHLELSQANLNLSLGHISQTYPLPPLITLSVLKSCNNWWNCK